MKGLAVEFHRFPVLEWKNVIEHNVPIHLLSNSGYTCLYYDNVKIEDILRNFLDIAYGQRCHGAPNRQF